MKTLISLLIALGLCGCSTLQKTFYTPQPVQVATAITNAVVASVTNAVPTVTTNQIDGGSVEIVRATNYVIATTTNYIVHPAVWRTNLVVRQDVQVATDTLSAVPVPGAGLAASLISLAVAGYASYRNRSNQTKANQLAGTLVDNFEHLRRVALSVPGYSEQDDKVMSFIKSVQSENGVKAEVNALVDSRTSPTVPFNPPQ